MERRSGLERGREEVEESKAVGEVGSPEGFGEAEKCDVKRVGDGKESFERVKEIVRVDLDEGDEEVSTGGEGTVPGGTVQRGLHDGCFENRYGLFAKSGSHGMSEGSEV